MTNKLNLEQILEVVKEKFVEAYIEDTRIYLYKETDESYLYIKDNKIVYQPDETARFNWEEFEFDDIIQLKHYLNIPLLWEDLVEWAKQNSLQFDKSLISKELYISIGGIQFFEDGTILTYNDSISNRSYWQMYQIIKNLVEN